MIARDELSPGTRRLVASAAATALLFTGPSPVAAGGWWSTPQLEHQTPALAVGEITSVSASVLFDSTRDAEAAADAGGHYAFLVRGLDEVALQDAMTGPEPDDRWTTPAETIRLGPVSFGANDANLAPVSARFVVPDVPAGVYDLMLCDADCSEPLGDVVPLRSVYVGDVLAVQLLRESRTAADQLHLELGRAGERMAELDVGIRELESQMERTDVRLDETTSALQLLDRSLRDGRTQGAAATPTDGGFPWAGGGWFVAGAAVAVAWARRRAVVEPDDDGPSSDEEDENGASDLTAPGFVTSS